MFVSTSSGKIINADHIVSVEEMHGGGHSVTFTDGHKARLGIAVIDLEEMCGTVVVAPPGFVVFEICIPSVREAAEGLLCIEPRPIIAFRVTDTATCPVPITAGGTASTSCGWTYVVRGPEGRWIGPDGEYEHAADFKRACEQRLADAVARRPRPVA